MLYGLDGVDKLAGGVGSDVLDGGDGNGDRLYGEEDNDYLGGGAGSGDYCSGGSGTDGFFPYPSIAGCETTLGIP